MRIRVLVATLSLGAAIALAQPPALVDLVLISGKVFTADPAGPWAEAVAIRGERIVEVGTTATVRARAGSATRVIDAGGRVVIPDINDAHRHVGARPPGVVLKVRGNDPTLDEVMAAIRDAAAAVPVDGWMYGTIGEGVLSDPKATRFPLDAVVLAILI